MRAKSIFGFIPVYQLILSGLIVFTGFSAYADYCWKSSYGRGIGKIPGDCGANEKSGLLCYPKCGAGYKGVGPVCWQTCPNGFKDTGAFCLKPKPYGRGAGYAIWSKGKCEKENPSTGCEKSGLLYYPRCKPGYKAIGCCICSPKCPANMGTDIGVSCTKKTYTRKTIAPSCSSNQDSDAGLCYTKCKSSAYKGVGPVCWEQCPAGMTDCGGACADSTAECATSITTMVSSVATAAANIAGIIATLGTSAGAEAGANAARQSAITALKEVAKKLAKSFAKKLATTAAKELKPLIAGELMKIKGLPKSWADKLAEMAVGPDEFDYQSFLMGLDPTGIAQVVEAFNKEVCSQ